MKKLEKGRREAEQSREFELAAKKRDELRKVREISLKNR